MGLSVEAGEQMQTDYVTINVGMEPFDDVRVRQALNMAIDEERTLEWRHIFLEIMAE